MAHPDLLVTYTISIGRNGDIYNDTQAHGNTFADVYRGFYAIKAEVDRQIAERRECPYNPITRKSRCTRCGQTVRSDTSHECVSSAERGA